MPRPLVALAARLARLARLAPVALVALLSLTACQEAAAPRSLILVSIDTLRADHLGVARHVNDATPYLDVLAAEGLVFDQLVSPAENTLIAHGTLFTGLSPAAHGAQWAGDGRVLAPAARTLAEDLREAGFQTAGFAAHGDWLNAAFGMDRGFEVFHSEYRGAEDVLAEAEHWLGGVDPARPFFLFIHLFDAHSDSGPRPYEAPEGFAGLFTAEYTGPLADWNALPAAGSAFLQGVMDNGLKLEAPERLLLRNQYDEGLRAVDASFGRFLQRIEPWRPTTWVAVTSDHGEEFGEHGRYLHSSLHDEVLHVPWLLAPPRLDAGVLGPPRHVAEQVRLMDLRPTLVGLLGLPPAARTQGEDLSAWLSGDAGDCPAGPALGYHSVLRSDGYKLLVEAQGLRLYDLTKDPDELLDLAAEPAQAERLEAMRAELHRLARLDTELATLIQNEAPAPAPDLQASYDERLQALGYTR